MTKEQAIFNFWNSFVPAYEENSVDPKAQFPYISYNLLTSEFGVENAGQRNLWTRGSSWRESYEIRDRIDNALKHGGVILPCDEGSVWIKKGVPFAQNMRADEDDPLLKREYMNVIIEFLTI